VRLAMSLALAQPILCSSSTHGGNVMLCGSALASTEVHSAASLLRRKDL
jgi:hypothetical protein